MLCISMVAIAVIMTGLHCEDSPYWIYGLFSISSCESRYPFNCLNALKNQQIMEQTFTANKNILKSNIDFCARDIGDSQPDLIKSVLSGLFDGEFNTSALQCIDQNVRGLHKTEALFVYTHVTFELTKLISAILMPFQIPLIAITFQSMYPIQYVSHPLYVYSYEASFGRNIHKTGIKNLRKELNISIAAILNLVDYTDDNKTTSSYRTSASSSNGTKDCGAGGEDDDKGAFCTYIGLEMDGCLKEKYLNVDDEQDLNRTLDVILDTPRLSFVVVQGSSGLLGTFRRKVDGLKENEPRLKDVYFIDFEPTADVSKEQTRPITVNKRWFAHSRKSYDYVYNLPGSYGLNVLLHYIQHIQVHFFTKNFFRTIQKYYSTEDITKILLQKNSKDFNILKYVNLDLNLYNRLPKQLRDKIYEELIYTPQIVISYFRFWRELFYVDVVELEKVLRLGIHNPKNALKAQPSCQLTIPQCKAGTQLLHTFYTEPKWYRSYGYHCKKCPNGFHKEKRGNSKCITCPFLQRSTVDRKSCYDPYTSVYLKFDDSVAMVTYTVVSAFHGIFMLLTFYIFYRKRHTPLVLASDRNFSFVQIATHILLTFVPLLTFSEMPSVGKCMARPITTGILFSITIAINFGKTQKVLRVFESKMIMSRREVMVTRATELFAVILVLLIDATILVSSLAHGGVSSLRAQVTYYEHRLEKEYHCSNNNSMVVQFAFVFVVILINAVQGIRARNLPSQYRETVYVIYASFTSSIILVAAAAVYLSQSDSDHARTVVLLFTSLALNISHFVLIYLYKVYFLLFRPHLNRASVFRRERQMKTNEILVN